MAKHNEIGKKGEAIAVDFILKKGYQLLEKNWRHKKYEIDIIARDKKDLAFIEVKTRSTNYFGEPEEAVDMHKEKHLIEGAAVYVEEKEIDLNCRFDIISIVLVPNKKPQIKHIEDAFSPLWGE